jgi:copper chaperone
MKTENNSLQFKTNINCDGCITKVTPFLNEAKGINHWEVNTANQDKILTVQTDGITKEEIIRKVQEAGFKIELLKQ